MSATDVQMTVNIAGARDALDEIQTRMELAAWRRAGGPLLVLVERVLAAQGDAPERELIHLQHLLAVLLRPQAAPSTEQSTSAQQS